MWDNPVAVGKSYQSYHTLRSDWCVRRYRQLKALSRASIKPHCISCPWNVSISNSSTFLKSQSISPQQCWEAPGRLLSSLWRLLRALFNGLTYRSIKGFFMWQPTQMTTRDVSVLVHRCTASHTEEWKVTRKWRQRTESERALCSVSFVLEDNNDIPSSHMKQVSE